MPLLPMLPGETPIVPIRPESANPADMMSGGLYFGMVFILGMIIVAMIIFWILIKIYGDPILKFKSARGSALIQHFENSKIGTLLIAQIGGGALRHKNVQDGTLVTIPKGINSLSGTSFVLSWHLTGISIPVFLVGAVNKLRQLGIFTRKELDQELDKTAILTNRKLKNPNDNLINESYDFKDFNDVIYKSQNPSLIPLAIEFVSDYIPSTNQHYTEGIINMDVQSEFMMDANPFQSIFITTAIGMLIVAIGLYFLSGMVTK